MVKILIGGLAKIYRKDFLKLGFAVEEMLKSAQNNTEKSQAKNK